MERNISPSRIQKLRSKLELSQDEFALRLGVSRNYVSMLERGAKEVSETSSIGILFSMIEGNASGNAKTPASPTEPGNSKNLEFPGSGENSARAEFSEKHACRRIGVIGWAHAGQAASYEEIPDSWKRTIPTDCRDPHAFAVTLEGDSMEPLFRDGDTLVLMPSERIYNGCIAVLRLASDGVLLRRLETRDQRLRLVPLNPRYEVEEMDCDQISWAYPVWGRWSQVWK